MRATMVLGVPLIGAQLAQMAVGVTDTLMLGWLGATDLAAGVLGAQAFFVAWVFGSGFAQAVMPIAANAEGRGDIAGVRRSVRMGLWVLLIYGALSIAFLWNTEAILLLLGQEPHVAALAGDYMMVVMWAIFPSLLVIGLRSFLTTLEMAQVVLWATVAGAVLNVFLNYAFIFGNFGAPRLEIVGAAVASLGTHTLTLVVLFAYTLAKKRVREYEIYVRFWRPDWPAFFEVVRLGVPISATILAEVTMFIGASIMMGWLGTVALAAHGIAIQLASVAFMIPLGISFAATVRVGTAAGRGSATEVGLAGYAAVLAACAAAALTALILVVGREPLVRLFLDFSNENAAAVLAYAVPLVLVAVGFQLADSLQAVLMGALRGLKDTKVPMVMALIGYWGVGFPVAYILAFPLGLEGVGLWIGLAFGLTAATTMFGWRFARRERLGLIAAAA